MDSIIEFTKIDFVSFLIVCFLIMSAITFMASIIGGFSKLIGKPVKWVRRDKEDHMLILKTAESLNTLQKKHDDDIQHSTYQDTLIRNDLKKLTDMFLDKQIDDMRYEILDFASALSSGRKFSKEQYDHILKIYEKYEKILREHKLTNGQVHTSMEVINELYKEKLLKGF